MSIASDSFLALFCYAVFGFVGLGVVLFALSKRERANGELLLNQEEIAGRADDIGSSDQSRASSLEPPSERISLKHKIYLEPPPEWISSKHKIFLCHSGYQKPFTEHLCEKLEAVQHYPFFDRRADNLRKGEKSYSPLMKAAEECHVAIVVLSDEFFTKSKWPMMELNKFVKAQESHNKRLKILPLFYKISRAEFERRKNGKEWMVAWKTFQRNDKSIDLSEWKHAISKIQVNNGMEYVDKIEGESEGEAEFIKRVVEAMCNLPYIQPDVKWDVSHVQSKEALCEPLLTKLKEVEQSNVYKVKLVGLYGMGGVGKTTLSKMVCNQIVGDFKGKVCHVEFSGMKSVLREFTEAGLEIFNDNHDKLVDILKKHMHDQKVFLVLDNIWDEHVVEVEEYLNANYHDGSMVLLTSRSQDVLKKQLHISSSLCMEMPYLDQTGAIDVFLHYCDYKELTLGIDAKNIVERCVEACYFSKEEKVTFGNEIQQIYHPLALKILGKHLKSKRFEEWEKALESVNFNKSNMLNNEEHPLFSILRTVYDALNPQSQNIFLDLVLTWRSKDMSQDSKRRFKWEWLCKIHRMSKVDMEESVYVLQRKGLLENVWEDEELEFSIHDLYVEFAEVEVQHGALSDRCLLLNKNGTDVLHKLSKEPSGLCWPSFTNFIVIKNSTAQSLKRASLHTRKNVELLAIDCCDELQEVDVGGLVHLTCIVITNCKSLRKLVGLDKLSNLIILRCNNCPNFEDLNLKEIPYDSMGLKQLQHLDMSCCKNLSSIVGIGHATALQYLNASKCSNLKELPPDFGCLKQLQHLDVSGCENLSSIVGSGHAIALQHLDASRCPNLKELPDDFVGLKQLQHLNVSECENLSSLDGIGHAIALQHLDASRCSNLKELPYDFVSLKELQHLNVSGCENLSNIVGIGHATALQRLYASRCPNLEELPDDFVGLKQVQHLDVSGCETLSSIFGIGYAIALQHLDVSGCPNLKELPDDFGDLKELQYLDIRGCGTLSNIVPIGNVTSLQYLDISRCTELKELRNYFVGLKQLQYLNVSGCENLSSIVGIGHVTSLQHLDASGCPNLKELPNDFVGLKQLQHLDVSSCETLSSIVGIGHATSLQHLNISECTKLKELPDDFVALKELQYLDVSWCKNLSSVVGIGHATSLQRLDAAWCSNLKELPDDFVGLKQLQHLDVSGCENLSSIFGIGHATALQHLDASWCSSLKELPYNLVDLKQLQHLNVSSCWNLLNIVGIGGATALQYLDASECANLKELPADFVGLKQLQHLDVSGCENLASLVGISHATALQRLYASRCPNLKELPNDFVSLKRLQHLDVSGIENLSSIVGICHTTSLQHWDASGYSNLKVLPGDFRRLKLPYLDVSGCENLSSIVGVGHATAFQYLDADMFIKRVVKAVHNMGGLQSDVEWDVSHVQAKEGSFSSCQRSYLLFQLDKTRRHLLGCGYHDPTNERYNAVHRKLYRALEQIETWCQDWRIPEVDSIEFIEAKWLEHFLEMLFGVRWWTMVMALQAGQNFPDNLKAYEVFGQLLFSKRKRVLEANNGGPSKSPYERHFPSYEFEKWLREPENRGFDQILQRKVESGNILEEDEAKLAFEVIRTASFPGFVIEGTLVSSVDDEQSPLIEEEVTVDLTQDVLGVGQTGSWVIRTKCQGKDCALKRVALKGVEDGDTEQPVIARLSHPHIVQLMHYWKKGEYLFLVMELMEGDLTDLVIRHKGANESLLLLPLAVDIMLKTAKGMLYLHDLDITYPFLDCSNVLFRKSGTVYEDPEYMIKLSGGGYSVKGGTSSERKTQDVYRFGLFCLEVLTGRQQYEDSLDIVAGTRPSIPEAIPLILKFCIASCFECNPQFGLEKVVTLLLLAECQVLTSQKAQVFLLPEIEDREAVQLNQHNSASPSTSDADQLEKYPIHQLYPEPDMSDSDSYSASNSSATLIFFHGFAKSPDEWKSTWMTRNREHVWPKAWLPNGLSPNVRILSVSYDSDAPGKSQDISAIEIGKNLLRQLVLSSKRNLGGPIVLIGHSFGGLIIKSLVVETRRQIQLKMEERVVDKCIQFLGNLRSIVFYSVPGSTTEDQQFQEYIVRLDQTGVLQRSSLMQALLKDTELFDQEMRTLCKEFEENVPDTTKILVFMEGKGMRRIGGKEVVSEASARAQLQADFHLLKEDNHFEVCRPVSADHKGYKILVEHILKVVPEIGL